MLIPLSFFNMKFSLGAIAMLASTVLGAPPMTPKQRDLLQLIETREVVGRDEVETRDVSESPKISPRAPTCNTPSNRACWSPGFDINTDFEVSWPTTGVTRTVSAALSLSPSHRWFSFSRMNTDHYILPCSVHPHPHRDRQLDWSRWGCQEEGHVGQQ